MKTIDACGMSCPEPLLMLKGALKTEEEVALIVDNKGARDNCEHYAKRQGFAVNVTPDGSNYKLHIAEAK